MNRQAEWRLVNRVERRSGRRVVCTPGAFRPKVWTLPAVERGPDRPALVYYLELPGINDEDELIGWRRLYRVGEARAFTRGGYAIGLRELRLRDDPPSPRP